MAIGDRSKQLLANVRMAIGDEAGLTPAGLKNRVYDALHRVQRRIAEETLCLEKKRDMTLTAGEEFITFPDDMITELRLIPVGTEALVRIELDRVDELKRLQAATDTTTSELPCYYYKWDDKFGFLTAAGAISQSSMNFTVYYHGYPDDTSEKVSDSVDPLVSSRWETCLFYGAVAELSQKPGWITQYEAEFERKRANEAASRGLASQVPYNGDYD